MYLWNVTTIKQERSFDVFFVLNPFQELNGVAPLMMQRYNYPNVNNLGVYEQSRKVPYHNNPRRSLDIVGISWVFVKMSKMRKTIFVTLITRQSDTWELRCSDVEFYHVFLSLIPWQRAIHSRVDLGCTTTACL